MGKTKMKILSLFYATILAEYSGPINDFVRIKDKVVVHNEWSENFPIKKFKIDDNEDCLYKCKSFNKCNAFGYSSRNDNLSMFSRKKSNCFLFHVTPSVKPKYFYVDQKYNDFTFYIKKDYSCLKYKV